MIHLGGKSDVLKESIRGISREINRRQNLLAYIRRWLANRPTRAHKLTILYCYTRGPQLMRDIERLKAIRDSLKNK